MRVCRQCGNYGHLEYFCPVHPISRQATHALNHPQDDTKTGVKRQRTSESDVSETVTIQVRASQRYTDRNQTSVIAAGDPLRAGRLHQLDIVCALLTPDPRIHSAREDRDRLQRHQNAQSGVRR